MDIDAVMDELLEHGCILQSRENLARQIVEAALLKAAGRFEKRQIGFPNVEIVKEVKDALSKER